MGMLHGAWCLGCCWLLFAMLFPLGMMNVAAMAGVTDAVADGVGVLEHDPNAPIR
jgi:predicted metal-binding membrane protein